MTIECQDASNSIRTIQPDLRIESHCPQKQCSHTVSESNQNILIHLKIIKIIAMYDNLWPRTPQAVRPFQIIVWNLLQTLTPRLSCCVLF